ncbi:hypothetical protein ABF206_003005 [Aeromonas salmonicida]
MSQSTLQVVTTTAAPMASVPTKASRLDDRIAQFVNERTKLMALDDEVMTLREQRKHLQERVPPAKARLEELRQGRINQLMGGATSLDSAREYRELNELLGDAKEALTLSQSQERRLALPLYQAQLAVNNAQSIVAGCYESYLDHKVAPLTLKPLAQQLAALAALTHAKASIMGPEGAQRWAQNELARALKEAMSGAAAPLDGDHPAARDALSPLVRPRASDLFALCDSPGKRYILRQELGE